MSTPSAHLASPIGEPHPAVLSRRINDLLLLGVSGVIVLAIALAIALQVPDPSPVVALGVILGALSIVVFVSSTHYGVTLMLLALYLGLLDGPVKLESASTAASVVRDVLIFAIALGIAVRVMVRRQRVSLPALSGWVLAFVAIVLAEAVNPSTSGLLKVLGGFRQQLEWVPFFFFGYLVMRSPERFRKLFLLLGAIALLNGIVGAYQSHLSPAQLASWGPGYSERTTGVSGGLTGRTYKSEGVARVRPPALGSDAGFGGGVGVLALPGLLALLAVGRVRRRWVIGVLCLGAILGIATSASRSDTIIAVIALLSFVLLSVLARLRLTRSVGVLLAAAALTVGVGTVLIALDGGGVFARQETVTSASQAQSTGGGAKEKTLAAIPRDIASAPFGVGLGTYGSASGFGGQQHVEIEGKTVSGESAYNLEVLELGFPGLLLWCGLSLNVLLLVLSRLRRIEDIELRTYLVAVAAVFIAFSIEGLAGPTLAVSPSGTYLWFAAGVVAYWLAGPGWIARSTLWARVR
jgi:putative inorganic carbon (HCO3(-)) transporter